MDLQEIENKLEKAGFNLTMSSVFDWEFIPEKLRKAIAEYYEIKGRESLKPVVCECGSDKTGCGGHSTWCPMYKEKEV